MLFKDRKDFPKEETLRDVIRSAKVYYRKSPTVQQLYSQEAYLSHVVLNKLGKIEVLERLDEEKVNNIIERHSDPNDRDCGVMALPHLTLAQAICQKFGTPKIDEGRVAFKCVDAIDGHIISLDGEQKELCYQAIAKELEEKN